MSGRLVSCVLTSSLPHRLKTLAAVLASFGRDDGTSIRPRLSTIARAWGRSERRTQAALTDLQRLDVLVVVRRRTRSRPMEYRIDLDRLAALTPAAPSWSRRPSPRQQIPLPLFSTGPAPYGRGGVFHISTALTGRFDCSDRTLPSGTDPCTRSVSTNYLRARETKARGR